MSQHANIETKQTLVRLLRKIQAREDCQAECVQITMSIPQHPWEDITAAWWTEEAPALIESIEELIASAEEKASC